MARLFPIVTWSDSSGILASGTINTYEAGTTTNKATYTDRAAGTPNANPIVLDSNGSAQIWMDTDLAYKLLVKDSDGNTKFTIDNIVPTEEFLSSSATVLPGNLDVVTYSIVSTSARDIAITPDSTGDVVIDGLKWPQVGGTASQVLSTDGAAQLSWITPTDVGIQNVVEDTTPQLGGTLDTNAFNIEFDTTKGIFDDSSNEQLTFTKTASAVNYLTVTNNTTGSAPIISGAGDDANVSVSVQPKAGGNIILDNHTWPNTDGAANQVIQTDGAGVLSFSSAGTGKIIQYVTTTSGTAASTSTTIPADTSTPQNTEGSEFMTLAITPTSTGNKLIIDVHIPVIDLSAQAAHFIGAIFQDSTADALQAAAQGVAQSDVPVGQFCIRHIMTAGTESATTFKFRYGPSSGTAYVNQQSADALFSSIMEATMTIQEVVV